MKPASEFMLSVLELRKAVVAEMSSQDAKPMRKPAQDVPDEISVRTTLRGRKNRGGYLHICRNDDYGVMVAIERETRNSPTVQIYFCDDIPGLQAETWPELRQAMRALPRSQA